MSKYIGLLFLCVTLSVLIFLGICFPKPAVIKQVDSSVFTDGDGVYKIGSMVTIAVYGEFQASDIIGGTIRIASSSQHYDSGIINLTLGEGSNYYFAHWDTTGLRQANDYVVTAALVDKTGQTATDSGTVISLLVDPIFKNVLVSTVDLYFPSQGMPINLSRTYHARNRWGGPLGYGWTHSYNIHLTEYPDGKVCIFESSGDVSWYSRNPSGDYQSRPFDFSVFSKTQNGFSRRHKDGMVENFNAAGKLISITDPNGNQITFEYNTNDVLNTIESTSGQIINLTYDTENRIVRVTDPIGRVTGYEYDAIGNLVSVTDPAGYKTNYTYDDNHNLISIRDPDGHNSYFNYDAQNRLIAEYKEGNQEKKTYEYSITEPKITIIDALGNQTTLTYDGNNKVISMADALGNVTYLAYDEKCNLKSVTDANGHKTDFTYDDKGNMLTMRNALGYTTTYTFENTYNKVTSITDTLGRTITFDYDAKCNLLKIAYPDGSCETYSYDNFGNAIELTNQRGMTCHRTYNANGQCTSETYLNNTVNFSYDDAGNLTSFTDLSGTTIYAYDILNRVTKVEYPLGYIIKYEYDPAGYLVGMTYPDGSVLNYTYDSANRLISINSSINGSSKEIVKYFYDNVGRRIKEVLGNGAYTTYTHDAIGDLIEIANRKSSGEIISMFTYTYDKVGNRLSMTDSREGTYFYEYDAINQLIGYINPSGLNLTQDYDPVGNRISVSVNGSITNYTVNELNQYLQVENTSYSYDADGNLIAKTTPSGTTTYEFDVGGRLNQVDTTEGIIKYGYDLFGRRTSKTDSNGMTKYIYDSFQTVMEVNDTDHTLATYIYGTGTDEVLAMIRDGEIYFYHLDGLGSVTDLTDNTQDVVESYKYSPYGKPNITSSVGNPYMFTGREYEPETELYYCRARYYDPEIGRFVSVEPYRYNLIMSFGNLYTYAENNPVIYIDPYGLWSWAKAFSGFASSLSSRATMYSMVADLIMGAEFGAYCGIPGMIAGGFAGLVASALGSVLTSMAYGFAMGFDGGGFGGGGGGGECPTFIQMPRIPISPYDRQVEMPAEISNQDNILVAKIKVPTNNCLVRADIPVFGLAYGKGFKEYRVEYGEGVNPEEWITIETSTVPQMSYEVPPVELQGDIDIRGNLATWNTGLKEWEHLPWHPADDPTDLNGVYTLRLVVVGENETAEDRVVVEVGTVITRVLPGIAVSTDKKVTMRFQEQSIMEAFRVFTIKPVKEYPTISPGYKLVGEVYEIREPGEKFTKNVTLEMEYSPEDLRDMNLETLGIYTYNWEDHCWKYLKSWRKAGEDKIITQISETTPGQAIYCTLSSPFLQEESEVYQELYINQQEILDKQALSNSIFLCNDTFEENLDEWANRDGEVGAAVSRDKAATIDGSYCLKLTNKNFGGNFASTVRHTPFDVREYPIVEFDYNIPPDVKIDFLAKVDDRWYDILFTDYQKEYKYKDLNMAGIGTIENVIADGKWHHAEFNLYEMLKTKTANHIVQEMIMADWDVSGFMKLEFGKNRKDTTYYIDNFVIRRGPYNPLNNMEIVPLDCIATGVTLFTDPEKKANIQMSFEDDASKGDDAKENKVLKLSWDVTEPGSFAGYCNLLGSADVGEFKSLTFWVRGEKGAEDFLVGLRDESGYESKVCVDDYLSEDLDTEWQKVIIPLAAFRELPRLNSLESFSICFENGRSSGNGTIFIDDVQFEKELGWAVVEKFDGVRERNFFGGDRWTFCSGAAIINATYENEQTSSSTACGCKVVYGGDIGKDLGGGNFSYCGWVTQLRGIDATGFESIYFYIRGEEGGEKPNIYLTDGTKRACVDIENYAQVSTDWKKVVIPLAAFSERGVDITHLEEFQMVFEWEKMSGTVYIDNVGFSQSQSKKSLLEESGITETNNLRQSRTTSGLPWLR